MTRPLATAPSFLSLPVAAGTFSAGAGLLFVAADILEGLSTSRYCIKRSPVRNARCTARDQLDLETDQLSRSDRGQGGNQIGALRMPQQCQRAHPCRYERREHAGMCPIRVLAGQDLKHLGQRRL